MRDTLVLVLTAVIAAATTVYTVYAVRLFRASQTAKEIARQAALLQLWERMLDYARRHEAAPTPESRLYREFADALITFIITELTAEVRRSTSPAAVAFRREVAALMQRHEVGADDLAWMAPLAAGPAAPR